VAGESQSAQKGFDQGYRKGAESAMELGVPIGMLQGMENWNLPADLKKQVQELRQEFSAAKEYTPALKDKFDTLMKKIG
jgi:flagellar biosynthesis/type III secretory pathway protein FliH